MGIYNSKDRPSFNAGMRLTKSFVNQLYNKFTDYYKEKLSCENFNEIILEIIPNFVRNL